VPGTAFSLGWLMAQLFDERRLKVDELFTPPFDPAVQLPLVAELDLARRRRLALTDLSDLMADVASGVPAPTVAAVREAGLADQVDEDAFAATLQVLHQEILDQLVGSDPKISAYQLGIALSDTCWLAKPDGGPEAFIAMFQRGQVASLKAWLASSGDMIAPGAAGIVGQSLDNWQGWIEVNAKGITGAWTDQAEAIVTALHIQAMAWHSVLVGDPQTSGGPTMNAWVQASSSVVRAARKVTVSVLRRFWWLVLLIVVVVAGVLALLITTLHGQDRIWTSLLWLFGSIGGASYGFQSAIGNALSGVGSEVWNAARGDAAAWNVTWLPTVQLSASQRRGLFRAGVALPAMHPNLAAAGQPGPKA
jgi:hypothetical protein